MLASHATNAVEIVDRKPVHWKECVNDNGLDPFEPGISKVGVKGTKCGRNRCTLQCEDGYLPEKPNSRAKTWCRKLGSGDNQDDKKGFNENGYKFGPLLLGCTKVCPAITNVSDDLEVECYPKNDKSKFGVKKCYVSCKDKAKYINLENNKQKRKIVNFCTCEKAFPDGVPERSEPVCGWESKRLGKIEDFSNFSCSDHKRN